MRVIMFVVIGLAISACSAPDPQTAYDRRQAVMADLMPDPADRAGLDLVFPIYSRNDIKSFIVEYFPNQVSADTVVARLAKVCGARNQFIGADGQAFIDDAPEDTTIGRPDGTRMPGKKMVVDCGSPS
ncbi:hypothetical protein RA2_02365 [Roseovarius sp. A-2]|nr:hypothetical protein RA2_02365 [Roseovarius sp. A-2]